MTDAPMRLPYRMHGWAIDSPDIELPAPRAPSGGVDLTIHHRERAETTTPVGPREDALLLTMLGDEVAWGMWRAPGGFDLVAPRIGRFLIRDECRRVVCESHEGPGRAIVPLLTNGGALSVVLTLRGAWVLHASAVRVGDKAVLLGGGSGRGKSTLATLLVAAGAEYMADDLVRVSRDDLLVHPGSNVARLRMARELIDRWVVHATRVSTSADGRVEVEYPAPATASPLGLIMIPILRTDVERVMVERLEGAAAFEALHSASRLWGWRDEHLLRQEFDRIASLASRVSIVRALIPVRRPVERALGEELLGAVEDMLRRIP